MFDVYNKKTGNKVNYQAIGSGGGVRQLAAQLVDFGASDAYVSDAKMKKSQIKSPVIHVPITSGAVTVAYNLPNVKSLNMTGEIVEGIYTGEIKRWNDKKIKAINPGVSLPNMKITVVYRSDGSGTTFIFTDYLSKVSYKWRKKVGAGKAVRWPVGIGGKGNSGVAKNIQNIVGACGYVELNQAKKSKLSIAKIQNKAGNFIEPSKKSVSAAAAMSEKDFPDDTRLTLTDTPATYGYPISGFTWILVYVEQNYKGRSKEVAKATKDLITWMITKGGQDVINSDKALGGYAPLSKLAAEKGLANLKTLTYNGSKL